MSRPGPRRSRAGSAVDTATRRAVTARDAGLRRIGAVTRWSAAAVIALSGALALIAAKGFHGHTTTATQAGSSQTTTPAVTNPATTTPAVTTPATTTPATTTPSVQQPSQAPSPYVQQPPVAISGGS